MQIKQTSSQRIDIADVLRGIAVLAIILLHSIEHFNFYVFPDTSDQSLFLNFTDRAVWDGLFFVFAGKAYAIFALLFGFSFYIQDSKQQSLGNDFRLRFCWRLVLLFVIGNLNALFFTAEVLVLYSIVGFIMPLTARMSNKSLFILGAVLLVQPLHVVYTLISVCDPSFVLPSFKAGELWGAANDMHINGNFIEMSKTNLWEGQLASLAWAWDNGRFFQSAALFIFGMLIGRRGLFLRDNLCFWYRSLAWSLILFFPLFGLSRMMLPEFILNPVTLKSLKLVLTSLSNFAFTLLLVSSITILYYNSDKIKTTFSKIIPYGRMSLTNYLTQSIIGSFIFYNWGLGLYDKLGITYSVFVGIAIFIVQFVCCKAWLKRYKQGPFEYIWKKLTWIKF